MLVRKAIKVIYTPRNHGGMYEHGLAILALSKHGARVPTQTYVLHLRGVDITIHAQNHQEVGVTILNQGMRTSMTNMQTVRSTQPRKLVSQFLMQHWTRPLSMCSTVRTRRVYRL